MTRMQYLQLKMQRKTMRVEAMLALLQYMRSESDQQASELLARLRLGESMETLTQIYVPHLQTTALSVVTTGSSSQPQYG